MNLRRIFKYLVYLGMLCTISVIMFIISRFVAKEIPNYTLLRPGAPQSESLGANVAPQYMYTSFYRGAVRKAEDSDRSLIYAESLASKFSFTKDFSFPQPKIMRQLSKINLSPWIYDLRKYLFTVGNSTISLLTSNSKYTDVLLNWLISATVRSSMPLKSMLILSLDEPLHNLLLKKKINSVHVPPKSLFDSRTRFSEMFEEVMMTRLAVMRIINHFGYDVVMYDTDAIILKNPEPMYIELPYQHIIGSVGKIPFDLVKEWGITICIGVVLVRSSPKTETYWNSMKDICSDSVDDQAKLNCGLKALDIRWMNNGSSQQNTTVYGVTKNGLRVSILPYDDICRQWACDVKKRERYYIWHKGGQRSRRDKLVSARDGKTWFLKYKWNKIVNTLTGVKWLNSIAYQSVVHS